MMTTYTLCFFVGFVPGFIVGLFGGIMTMAPDVAEGEIDQND